MKKLILCLLCSLLAFMGTTQRMQGIAAKRLGANPFKFGILTAEADDSFTLPLFDGGTYNCTVNWGDLSTSEITSYDDADITHTYSDEGATAYSIEITGTLISWGAQDVQNGVTFSGGNSKYSAGDAATARAHLMDVETGHSWSITDGGQEP